MEQVKRLYFIDAMRAWAILMMLQGHFIDSLLDPVFRDPENPVFATWKYFRGITAPVFFTVSGFIFTYLLMRVPRQGVDNPRIRKGLKRGLQLIFIGYLLRTNLFGLLKGELYPSFFMVDVLHCIGMALLVIIGLYLISVRVHQKLLPLLLLGISIGLFLFEPMYKTADYSWLPDAFANYFTKANGSVFTIIPWVGYTTFGGFLSLWFRKFAYMKGLYLWSIAISILSGCSLIWLSSPFFEWMYESSGIDLFGMIVSNNYLFIRLGDVMLVFAVFMILRSLVKQRLFLQIGQNTLSIYVIHFIILYGSLAGVGLYQFWHHQLSPQVVIIGALAFMISSSYLALLYDRHEAFIREKLQLGIQGARTILEKSLVLLYRIVKGVLIQISRLFSRA
ncbi:acyltransferase family protein [Robiginitalea sp. IMCC43444]|uniref:acyltransferase family protein n=1 Tax=Robiginitalea sp. IMCC43444 TaxID=3459121 RepID=UPI0040422F3F